MAVSSAHPAVLAALHARLRHVPTPGPSPVDVRFAFYGVAERHQHLVAPPPRAARPVYDPPVGEVTYVDHADQLYINYADRVRVLCDPGQGQVWVSFLQAAVANLWLLSHPMFTLPLVELFKRRGRYSLHAAGLCVNGRGLLLPGTSGAGKSTLTIALVRAGFGLLGDDMVFLTPGREGVRMLAFPDEIDVTDETAGWFPELHHLVQQPKTPGWPKRPVWPEDVYATEIVWACRPAALVFPRVAHTDKSVLTPMDRGEALLALAPNVLLTEASSTQAHLDVLAQLVRESPCYHLEAGRDFAALPSLLREVVA
jgi:hypothetical protein